MIKNIVLLLLFEYGRIISTDDQTHVIKTLDSNENPLNADDAHNSVTSSAVLSNAKNRSSLINVTHNLKDSNPRPRVLQRGKCEHCHGDHHSNCFTCSAIARSQQNFRKIIDRINEIKYSPKYAEDFMRRRQGHRKEGVHALYDNSNWNIIMSNCSKRGKFCTSQE